MNTSDVSFSVMPVTHRAVFLYCSLFIIIGDLIFTVIIVVITININIECALRQSVNQFSNIKAAHVLL